MTEPWLQCYRVDLGVWRTRDRRRSHSGSGLRLASTTSRRSHQTVEGTADRLVDGREERTDRLGERRARRHVRHPHRLHALHAARTAHVGVLDASWTSIDQRQVVGDGLRA